jgi:hypothetical protein
LNLKRGDWESTQEQPVIQRWKITKEEVWKAFRFGNVALEENPDVRIFLVIKKWKLKI